jgi:gamma-glutamyltranspeptidase / glutathione hydrolase
MALPRPHRTVVSALALSFAACGPGNDAALPPLGYTIPEQPEIGTGYTPKPGWAFDRFAVAAANPLATDAGYQLLAAGGSAVDAAIGVQMVLTLVEPQSSGIGGGTFLLHWDGTEVVALDGREVAPAAAGEGLFLTADGTPLPFDEAVRSGLSVGVPGTIAMLAQAHALHGRLPWADLFMPAIALAEVGFRISPRLHALLEADEALRQDDLARALYYDAEGRAHPVGYRLRNPALAEVLRRVAAGGAEAFYRGDVAEAIVDRVRNHPVRPGTLAVEDLAAYPGQEFRRDPICTPWRTLELCGFPPPSSGHIAVAQILGILEAAAPSAPAPVDGVPAAGWLHPYIEASRLAFADRDRYVGDPAFVDPPAGRWESLLDPAYLASRAALIGERSMGRAEAGTPSAGSQEVAYGAHPAQPEAGTSHVSIVDGEGNAVAMTTTIESGFGSRIMTDGGTGLPGGFHLNNELTDFSLAPADAEGRPIANRVQPGKRPRSSMSPTLVFDRESGALLASVGSPGGAAIIHYTAKALTGMFVWGLDAQRAIDLPNFVNYNGPTQLEAGRFPPDLIAALQALGHEVREAELTSGLQAIQRTPDGRLFGGADPRREGIVMGR